MPTTANSFSERPLIEVARFHYVKECQGCGMKAEEVTSFSFRSTPHSSYTMSYCEACAKGIAQFLLGEREGDEHSHTGE